MSESVRHGLPLLAAGQAQKEITHNEAVLAIDRRLQIAVRSRATTVPPALPEAGDAYIVPVGATGAWTGHVGAIASHDGFGWIFDRPVTGTLAWVIDEAVFAVFDEGWSVGGWPVTSLRIAGREVLGAVPPTVTVPAGGAIIDAEARASLSSLVYALRLQGIVSQA